MFSFDPIIRAIDGVRVELARANDLSEEAIRMHRQRYKQTGEMEAKLCEQNRTSMELTAIALGYEQTEDGYSLRAQTKPEKL